MLFFFQLEAGDIILAINEREVVKLSTKEVLKCLRLSGEIVNIKFKRGKYAVNYNDFCVSVSCTTDMTWLVEVSPKSCQNVFAKLEINADD